jgi:hypothetical protein
VTLAAPTAAAKEETGMLVEINGNQLNIEVLGPDGAPVISCTTAAAE